MENYVFTTDFMNPALDFDDDALRELIKNNAQHEHHGGGSRDRKTENQRNKNNYSTGNNTSRLDGIFRNNHHRSNPSESPLVRNARSLDDGDRGRSSILSRTTIEYSTSPLHLNQQNIIHQSMQNNNNNNNNNAQTQHPSTNDINNNHHHHHHVRVSPSSHPKASLPIIIKSQSFDIDTGKRSATFPFKPATELEKFQSQTNQFQQLSYSPPRQSARDSTRNHNCFAPSTVVHHHEQQQHHHHHHHHHHQQQRLDSRKRLEERENVHPSLLSTSSIEEYFLNINSLQIPLFSGGSESTTCKDEDQTNIDAGRNKCNELVFPININAPHDDNLWWIKDGISIGDGIERVLDTVVCVEDCGVEVVDSMEEEEDVFVSKHGSNEESTVPATSNQSKARKDQEQQQQLQLQPPPPPPPPPQSTSKTKPEQKPIQIENKRSSFRMRLLSNLIEALASEMDTDDSDFDSTTGNQGGGIRIKTVKVIPQSSAETENMVKNKQNVAFTEVGEDYDNNNNNSEEKGDNHIPTTWPRHSEDAIQNNDEQKIASIPTTINSNVGIKGEIDIHQIHQDGIDHASDVESNSPSQKSSNNNNFDTVDHVRRTTVAITGGALVGTGIALIPFPVIPGALVAYGGLMVLASEFDSAKKALDIVKVPLGKMLADEVDPDEEDFNAEGNWNWNLALQSWEQTVSFLPDFQKLFLNDIDDDFMEMMGMQRRGAFPCGLESKHPRGRYNRLCSSGDDVVSTNAQNDNKSAEARAKKNAMKRWMRRLLKLESDANSGDVDNVNIEIHNTADFKDQENKSKRGETILRLDSNCTIVTSFGEEVDENGVQSDRIHIDEEKGIFYVSGLSTDNEVDKSVGRSQSTASIDDASLNFRSDNAGCILFCRQDTSDIVDEKNKNWIWACNSGGAFVNDEEADF